MYTFYGVAPYKHAPSRLIFLIVLRSSRRQRAVRRHRPQRANTPAWSHMRRHHLGVA